MEGPAAALGIVDGLDLDGYHLLHAIRPDLLRRLGRPAEAASRPTRPPLRRTGNRVEQDFLEQGRANTRIE